MLGFTPVGFVRVLLSSELLLVCIEEFGLKGFSIGEIKSRFVRQCLIEVQDAVIKAMAADCDITCLPGVE